MSAIATSEEKEQILQTIEMFEVITQANPHDCQSLEILKEAYWKVGRQAEALKVTRTLADTYYALGQYSSALLEYEGILQKQPDDEQVAAILVEVEERLALPAAHGVNAPAAADNIAMDFSTVTTEDATLITTNATRRDQNAAAASAKGDDGNGSLAKFLVQHRIVAEEIVNGALERVQHHNEHLAGGKLALSLIGEILASRTVESDTLLCGILDRTKFAYIPLDAYDVDRQIVKMLPEDLTLGRLIVPFDLLSRTVMIAMANPFDAQGKEAAQQLFDYNIQWHLAEPGAIAKVLRDTYKIQ